MAVDVLVLGAGAGGMTAAAAAAALGLRVLLCEATDQVGGTTATSAGTVWIPMSDQAREAGVDDSRAKARSYLQALVGEDAKIDVFLDTGATALRFLELHTDLRFALVPRHPDYRQEVPGAVDGGRALAAVPYDGRLLGAEFRRIRPPREEFLALGGMMVGKDDIAPLTAPLSSWRSFRHSAALLARYAMDRLGYPRGTRLVMGNALVARLYSTLRRSAVDVRFLTHATRLLAEQGRVDRRRDHRTRRQRADRGEVRRRAGLRRGRLHCAASAGLRAQPGRRHRPRAGQRRPAGDRPPERRVLDAGVGLPRQGRAAARLSAYHPRPRQARLHRGRRGRRALHQRGALVPRLRAGDEGEGARAPIAVPLLPAVRRASAAQVRPRRGAARRARAGPAPALGLPALRRRLAGARRAARDPGRGARAHRRALQRRCRARRGCGVRQGRLIARPD